MIVDAHPPAVKVSAGPPLKRGAATLTLSENTVLFRLIPAAASVAAEIARQHSLRALVMSAGA